MLIQNVGTWLHDRAPSYITCWLMAYRWGANSTRLHTTSHHHIIFKLHSVRAPLSKSNAPAAATEHRVFCRPQGFRSQKPLYSKASTNLLWTYTSSEEKKNYTIHINEGVCKGGRGGRGTQLLSLLHPGRGRVYRRLTAETRKHRSLEPHLLRGSILLPLY